MCIKPLHLILIMCLSSSYLLAAPTKGTRARHKKTSKTRLAKHKIEGISPYRYVAGGALSIFPGFGVGHAVQRRWLHDYGWVFTAGQVASAIGIIRNSTHCIKSNLSLGLGYKDPDQLCTEEDERKKKIQPYFGYAFLAFKLGEIAHAWWPGKLTTLQRGRPFNPNAAVISRERYLLGGALGTLLGFGSGHAVQGRWQPGGRGWAYTLTQLPIFALYYSKAQQDKCEERARQKEREGRNESGAWGCSPPIDDGTFVFLAATFVISRIIEIFNVWDIDYHLHRVAAKNKRKSFLILPYAGIRGFGVQLAFAH